jgi:thymidylate synthase (FAD)
MAINIVNAPTIDIDTRSGGMPIPFINEIRNIWSGYRVCYHPIINWDDARPFKVADLDDPTKREQIINKLYAMRDAFVKDAVATTTKSLAIAERYKYVCNSVYTPDNTKPTPEEITTAATEAFNRILNPILNNDQEQLNIALECIRFINACKWIAPKLHAGHESPFEHGIITFFLSMVSRSLTHQLVRCRIASYSQASQRYISEDPDNLSFVIPTSIRANQAALEVVIEYLSGLSTVIKKLKNLGIVNEDIRCVYPNAMPTEIQVTMNLRELKHFIELRLDSHVQDEIRHVAYDLWTVMCNVMPFIWNFDSIKG